VWCGPGNTADDYNHLGQHRDVDECCRTHDNNCSHYISRHSEKYGLVNWVPFSRTTCKCDEEFLICLESIKSEQADDVGSTYTTFNGYCMNFTGETAPLCTRRRLKVLDCIELELQPIADWMKLRKYSRKYNDGSKITCLPVLFVACLGMIKNN